MMMMKKKMMMMMKVDVVIELKNDEQNDIIRQLEPFCKIQEKVLLYYEVKPLKVMCVMRVIIETSEKGWAQIDKLNQIKSNQIRSSQIDQTK